MRSIVTGGAGFIGSHIAQALLDKGDEVIVIDDLSAGKLKNVPEGAEFARVDVRHVEDYKHLFKDCDVVFHNAASKKNICLKDPARDMQVNGIGTLRLLEVCREMKVGKFIHASTGSVYGEVEGLITTRTSRNPVSYYGISKTAGESYVMLYSKYIDITILRYFHVWGERQESDPRLGGVVAIFMDRVKQGKGITIHGSGEQKRLFTHVSDIVEANLKAVNTPGVFNCASQEKTTIKELSRIVMEKCGDVEVTYAEPLEGDIVDFDVQSSFCEFRNFSEVWKSI